MALRIGPHLDDFSKATVFDGDLITIGSDLENSNHFSVSSSHLQPIHLKIVKEGETFVIFNITSDPFVLLNGLPFGRARILSSSLLTLHEITLRIDPTISGSNDEDLENRFSESLSRYPEDGRGMNDPVSQPKRALHPWILVFFGALLLLTGFAGTLFYDWTTDRKEEEQITAAEGIADIAMALVYAQSNQIKPQKQNWIDPEFLTNNLASIVSGDYPTFANIGSQGQFLNIPYFLRVYTSNDLNQFLVIAQPNPGWFPWVSPKAAIAVESQNMEIRQIDDIKALNRLLVSAHTLDETNTNDIFALVHQGELIPLATLGSKKGFSAPKMLALMHPGAENRVYNAPRYYHLGEMVLHQALALFQIGARHTHESERLQDYVNTLSKYPHIVLYDSQGIEKALESQRALNLIIPKASFLVAALNFSSNGKITSSHLLLNEEKTTQSQMALLDQVSVGELQTGQNLLQSSLLLELKEIATERVEALSQMTTDMIDLLNRNVNDAIPQFSKNFSELLQHYETVDQSLRSKASKQMIELYEKYAHTPLTEFDTYIKEAGIVFLARESIRQYAESIGSKHPVIKPNQVTMSLLQIDTVRSLSELDEAVSIASNLISLVHLPDPERVMVYQNEIRSKATQQLNRILLSYSSPLQSENLHSENRAILSNILKNAWITDPDEVAYYLNELDFHASKPRK